MRWLIICAIVFGLAGTARADDIWCAIFGHARHWPDCVQGVTCDDYCRKPIPCSRNCFSFLCPDYCPKPAPCACEHFQFGCDDYRRKPCPPLFCPPRSNAPCPCGARH